jgi:hypothetical protein
MATARAAKGTPKKPKRSAGEWRPLFLAGLRQHGIVRLACHEAGITRQKAYEHRAADPAFAAQWQSALDDAIDTLEEIARQRALESSDTLLIFLLKANRPAMYRDTYRHELQGVDGGPLRLQVEVVGDRAPAPTVPRPSELVAVPVPLLDPPRPERHSADGAD